MIDVILAFDLGTSSIKALLVDDGGADVNSARLDTFQRIASASAALAPGLST